MPHNFRNTLFWFLDWLKGSKVRKHYKAVKKIHEDHTSEFAASERKKYLAKILRHCTKTVPYYRNLGISEMVLERFPVVNKNTIRQNPGLFHSASYANEKTFKATTSGSTGTPFTVLHDSNKKNRHTADVRFYWEAVGHFWGTKFYYLKIWNQKNKKSVRVQKMQNIVPIDVYKMDDDTIRSLLKNIDQSTVAKSILGYASALDRIAKYLKRHPVNMADSEVISIVAMSEALDGPTKNALQECFGCPVVSRYANIENGMLAQQTSASDKDFLMNMASHQIEILSMHNNTPVDDGQMGRIVVTDLFNQAMPMIRYDTGDLGIMGKSKKDGKTHYVLKKVEGRKMDIIYDTHGEPISSFTITNSMWKYTELAQYQFVQNSNKDYEFKLNSPGQFLREDELITEFKGYLGQDAHIAISYVEEIPLLSSGKRKKVLNLTDG